MSVDVSIIVVGTNEKDFINMCLSSVERSKTAYSIETIVVDNASIDGTAEMVREKFKNVTLIRNQEKTGYIRNNNTAMKQARGRYILFINADIELREDTLQVTLDFMEKHLDTAACTCRLVFEDGALQLNCRRFPTPLTYFARIPHFFRWLKIGKRFAVSNTVNRYLMLDYDHKQYREVDWVVSAYFLLRKKAIDDIGMLDGNLMQPFYLEDVDWCFRARVRGWKIYYVPETYAVHYYQRTSVKGFNKLSIVHMVNTLIFFRKHGLPMLLRKHRRRSS